MADIPTQSLLNTLMQIYQATANTSGGYANLAGFLEPFYGALGLGNTEGTLFGYNNGAPAGPFGAPAAPAGAPAGPSVGPATPAGTPGSPVIGGAPGAPGAPSTGGSLYTPPEGTLIGLGKDRPFNDPYAGQTPPSAAGFQPGLPQLNTTALDMFGPGAADALLRANPYLSDSLNFSTLANLDASNPLQSSDILKQLNAISSDQLNPETFGQLSDQEARDLTQTSRTSLGTGGLIFGNTGDAADLLGRDRYVQQRQAQAQQLAALVQGLNTNQQGQELQRIGMAGNLANQTAATSANTLTSPILALLGFDVANPQGTAANAAGVSNALFAPFQNIGSDVLGFNANAKANSAIAGANEDAATQAGWLNLAGSFLGAFSDERLKKKVKRVGTSISGIPEYEFEYKTRPGKKFHGAKAQDLEKLVPLAVLEDPASGIKMVDYGKIDVPFYELNPYSKMRKAA